MNLSSTINALDKITTFRFFFLYGSFILLLDSSMICFTNTSLTKLTIESMTKNLGFLLLFLMAFSLIASVVPSTIHFLLKLICSIVPKKNEEYYTKEQYIDENTLLIHALKEKDKLAYDYLKDEKEQYDKLITLEKFAILFISSFATNYFFSNSLVSQLEIYLNTNRFFSIIVLLLCVALIIFMHTVICTINHKIYYPQNEKIE